MKKWLARRQERAAVAWRTSLQVRVIGSIFAASTVVMIILGIAMISVVTERLVDTKIENAGVEIDRVRSAVEEQIAATGTGSSTAVRINSARSALAQRTGESTEWTSYDPVLLVSDGSQATLTAPEGFPIPERLRQFVDEGQISYKFSTVSRADGGTYNALVIGSPTESDIPGLQVYLVISMEPDEETMALMRGLISTAAVVVVVLLVGIAWLLAQQVITPVKSAANIAQRLAAGHLRERMPVEGDDEVARLAVSFNSMAESLSDQIRQLKEYGDLQRQFTSDVSHELRTPLTTVRMAADMIEAGSADFEPGTRRATELMLSELDRFEALLGDLLEISRHDAGVADLAETHLNLSSVIRDAWAQVSYLADDLDVEVRFEGPEEPITIEADSRRLERILRNLLANAVDHSEGKPVTVNWAESDDAVAVTVTDHGVGLKPGQEELVFHRFWRADPSRVRHSGGTGLGLAIAQEDARLHGGELDAIGEEGTGSVFRLTLPRTPGDDYTSSPLPLEVPEDD